MGGSGRPSVGLLGQPWTLPTGHKRPGRHDLAWFGVGGKLRLSGAYVDGSKRSDDDGCRRLDARVANRLERGAHHLLTLGRCPAYGGSGCLGRHARALEAQRNVSDSFGAHQNHECAACRGKCLPVDGLVRMRRFVAGHDGYRLSLATQSERNSRGDGRRNRGRNTRDALEGDASFQQRQHLLTAATEDKRGSINRS
jgi:hypothetical protein